MERGISRVGAGLGEIAPARVPGPVGFDTDTFPAIVHNIAVLFERTAADPLWASRVVPAADADALVAHAISDGGATARAERLLLTIASEAVYRIGGMPAHLRAAEAERCILAMQTIGAALSGLPGRAGVADVRAALGNSPE